MERQYSRPLTQLMIYEKKLEFKFKLRIFRALVLKVFYTYNKTKVLHIEEFQFM